MKGSEFNYEVSITMSGQNIQDIQYCAFIRAPLIKQSSFCMLRIHVAQVLVTEFSNLISANVFPDVKLKVYASTEEDIDRTKRKINTIFSKNMRCIYIKALDPQAKQTRVHAEMILVHPTLYYLETTNTYNAILENTTAYGALEDFQDFLTANHGNIFQFRHVNPQANQNSYPYEQILVKACNDLNVPTYLIHTYKVNNSYSFYFFDDFYIADDSSGEVTCHYINLYDKNEFVQVDATKNTDMSYFTEYISDKAFCDRFRRLDKTNHTFIHNHQEISSDHKKISTSKIIKRFPSSKTQSVPVSENRSVKIVPSGDMSTIEKKHAATFSRTYVPDNIGNAEERFNLSLEMMTSKISRVCEFEAIHCYPDFPQFGRIYNLGRDERTNYIYTPINICNVFTKKGSKYEFMYHTSKALMIKYNVT